MAKSSRGGDLFEIAASRLSRLLVGHDFELGELGAPNAVDIATSAASRPRPIRMRPMRGWLWRASIVYQRPSRKTSNQALKSIGIGVDGNADVAEIAGAIARGDVHAAAERDGEMGEVAAYADAFAHRIAGAARRARLGVAEPDMARGRSRRSPSRAA